ncbi:MAG: hypothetical protein WD231_05360 [Candidatus Woykebacteria bacterium]
MEKASTTVSTKEIKKIHKLSSELSDLTENILESQGAYREEFLNGLKKSIEEERVGKVKKIKSLADLY